MIRLKVAEALQDEAGYGRGRLDTLTRNELGLSIGDIVEIHGRRRDPTVAIVWRARTEDEGMGIIRVDGLIRNNAKVNLGDKVEVKKAQVKPAQKVVLAPIMDQSEKNQLGPVSEEVILRGLLRRPITKGDVLTVPGLTLMGGRLPFGVIEVQPKGIIQLQADTVIQVHETSIKEEELTNTKDDDLGDLLDKKVETESPPKPEEPKVEPETAMGELEKLIQKRNIGEVTTEEFEEMKSEIMNKKIQLNEDLIDIDIDESIEEKEVKRHSDNTNTISTGDDKFAKLEKLTEMKKEGLIDDDEFKQMKKEILGK